MAASILACATVPEAISNAAGAPFWTAATTLAYPIGDLVLFGAVVSAVAACGWRLDRTLAVLAMAILAREAADVLYLFDVRDTLANTADALVLTGAVGIALAAYVDRRPPTRSRSVTRACLRMVSELARAVADRLGLAGRELEALRHAATLHDLGKMAIPGSILEKPVPSVRASGR